MQYELLTGFHVCSYVTEAKFLRNIFLHDGDQSSLKKSPEMNLKTPSLITNVPYILLLTFMLV